MDEKKRIPGERTANAVMYVCCGITAIVVGGGLVTMIESGLDAMEKQEQVHTRCVGNDKVFTKGDAIDTIEYHPDCLGKK